MTTNTTDWDKLGWAQLQDQGWNHPVTQMDVNGNSIVVGLGGGAVEFFDGSKWYELHNNGWNSAVTQMTVNWKNGLAAGVVVGLANGAVKYYDGTSGTWQELHDNGWLHPVNQMDVKWNSSGKPQIVVGLGGGAVEYYDGTKWQELHDNGWLHPVTQMDVKWNSSGKPQIVVGLDNGAVEYYDGTKWQELHDNGWKYAVNEMEVNWNSSGKPQIVVGLGGGAVEYYDGTKWQELHDNGWKHAVNEMDVKWNSSGKPQIVVGLDNGAVEYYDGTKWQELHNNGWLHPVTQMDVKWNSSGKPQVVVGLNNGAVEYYNSNQWQELHNTSWASSVNQMEVNWGESGNPPEVRVGLGDGQINYYTMIDFFNDRLADWMSWLNPEKKLSEIVIPGSHDSGSYSMTAWQNDGVLGVNLGVGDLWGQTQDATGWIDQLNAGVRYFDLRVTTDDNGKTIINHGVISGWDLDSQIEQFKSFIDQHPHEFIILDFQDVGNDSILDPNNPQSLQAILTKYLDIENTAISKDDGTSNLANVKLNDIWNLKKNFAVIIDSNPYNNAQQNFGVPDWMFKRSEALQSPFDEDLYKSWNPNQIIPFVEEKASEWNNDGKPTLFVAQDIGSGFNLDNYAIPIINSWETFTDKNDYSNGFNDWPKTLVENPVQPVNIVMRDFTNWIPETIANILEANIGRGNIQTGKEDEFNERLLETADFAALSPFQLNPITKTLDTIRDGKDISIPLAVKILFPWTNVIPNSVNLEPYAPKANSTLSQNYWDKNYPNIPRESEPYTIEIGAKGLPNAQAENTIEIVGNDFLGKNNLLNIPLQADVGEEVISWVKITSVAGAKNDGTFYGFGDGWVFQDSLDFHLFGDKNPNYHWKIEYETVPISTLNSDFFSNEPETNPNNFSPTFNFTGQANSPLKLVQHQVEGEIIAEEGSFYLSFQPHALNSAIVDGSVLEKTSANIATLASLYTDDKEVDINDDLITARTAIQSSNNSRETYLLALVDTLTVENNGESNDWKQLIRESLTNSETEVFSLPSQEAEGVMVVYDDLNQSPWAGSVLINNRGQIQPDITINIGIADLDKNLATEADQAIVILLQNSEGDISEDDQLLLKINQQQLNANLAEGDKFELVYALGQSIVPKTVNGTPRDDYFDSAFPDSKNFVGNEQTLFTGSGDDTVDVSQVGRKNRIDTGSGDDIVFAGTRNRIILGAGDDILFAGSGRGANRITLGAGKDQLWLTEDDRSIPRNPNQVSDFNPDDDVIGFANTVLSLGNKGDLWDYQQVGNDVMISAFGQEIAQLLNTTVTDSSFVFA